MMSEIDKPTTDRAVRLEPLAATCANGSCPTVYTTDRGTIVVQGYAVDGNDAGMTVPPGELLVEVPADLLLAAVRNQS